jgi:hypothetical protein
VFCDILPRGWPKRDFRGSDADARLDGIHARAVRPSAS